MSDMLYAQTIFTYFIQISVMTVIIDKYEDAWGIFSKAHFLSKSAVNICQLILNNALCQWNNRDREFL